MYRKKICILRRKYPEIEYEEMNVHGAERTEKKSQFICTIRIVNTYIHPVPCSVLYLIWNDLLVLRRTLSVHFHFPKRLLIMSIVSERFISVSIYFFPGITYYFAKCMYCNAMQNGNRIFFTLHFMIYMRKNEISALECVCLRECRFI